MKAKQFLVILTSSVFILSSCNKEVAGPTGPTGATGAQGPSSSYFSTVDSVKPNYNPGGWGFNNNTNQYTATIYVSGLTVPNNSIVEVYASNNYNKNNPNTNWYDLSGPNIFSTTDYMQFYYYTYYVALEYTFASAPTTMTYYKVVVITNP
jgi:hypothetical protein